MCRSTGQLFFGITLASSVANPFGVPCPCPLANPFGIPFAGAHLQIPFWNIMCKPTGQSFLESHCNLKAHFPCEPQWRQNCKFPLQALANSRSLLDMWMAIVPANLHGSQEHFFLPRQGKEGFLWDCKATYSQEDRAVAEAAKACLWNPLGASWIC